MKLSWSGKSHDYRMTIQTRGRKERADNPVDFRRQHFYTYHIKSTLVNRPLAPGLREAPGRIVIQKLYPAWPQRQ